ISPMRWMNKYVKIRAGTSLDWISWGPGYNAPKYQMLGNVITGLYYGYERATGRVLEFGLEYVRSLRSYELRHREATIKNKMDVLSVCFNYYLFKN
ncbi:MAG TPA: hypothetical protein VL947_14030, partial [Cytophagales bacterium]|nr:hypothetical protein [Cytophagales bacterium]